jgi:hypothetical protein
MARIACHCVPATQIRPQTRQIRLWHAMARVKTHCGLYFRTTDTAPYAHSRSTFLTRSAPQRHITARRHEHHPRLPKGDRARLERRHPLERRQTSSMHPLQPAGAATRRRPPTSTQGLRPSLTRRADQPTKRKNQGLRPHCSDPTSPHMWLSESEHERAAAVLLCDHCPVLTVCHDTAEQRDERWGVWGGVDFSVRPGRKKLHRQHLLRSHSDAGLTTLTSYRCRTTLDEH